MTRGPLDIGTLHIKYSGDTDRAALWTAYAKKQARITEELAEFQQVTSTHRFLKLGPDDAMNIWMRHGEQLVEIWSRPFEEEERGEEELEALPDLAFQFRYPDDRIITNPLELDYLMLFESSEAVAAVPGSAYSKPVYLYDPTHHVANWEFCLEDISGIPQHKEISYSKETEGTTIFFNKENFTFEISLANLARRDPNDRYFAVYALRELREDDGGIADTPWRITTMRTQFSWEGRGPVTTGIADDLNALTPPSWMLNKKWPWALKTADRWNIDDCLKPLKNLELDDPYQKPHKEYYICYVPWAVYYMDLRDMNGKRITQPNMGVVPWENVGMLVDIVYGGSTVRQKAGDPGVWDGLDQHVDYTSWYSANRKAWRIALEGTDRQSIEFWDPGGPFFGCAPSNANYGDNIFWDWEKGFWFNYGCCLLNPGEVIATQYSGIQEPELYWDEDNLIWPFVTSGSDDDVRVDKVGEYCAIEDGKNYVIFCVEEIPSIKELPPLSPRLGTVDHYYTTDDMVNNDAWWKVYDDECQAYRDDPLYRRPKICRTFLRDCVSYYRYNPTVVATPAPWEGTKTLIFESRGGLAPYTWSVVGTGAWFSPNITDNNWIAMSYNYTICGTITVIVEDACGNQHSGQLVASQGRWYEDVSKRGLCFMSGCGTLTHITTPVIGGCSCITGNTGAPQCLHYELIDNGWKQYQVTVYTGGGSTSIWYGELDDEGNQILRCPHGVWPTYCSDPAKPALCLAWADTYGPSGKCQPGLIVHPWWDGTDFCIDCDQVLFNCIGEFEQPCAMWCYANGGMTGYWWGCDP